MTIADRPNILIIYPDQWRFDALGCAGDPDAQTPNIDRLAREGMRLTHAFVANPVCTPSRGSFQTGRYPHATGVMENQNPLPLTEATFAGRLRDAGYRTGYIGKWHLNGDDRPGFVPAERRHGWEYWAGFNRGHFYYDGVYFTGDDPEPIPTPGFEPDHQTDLAIDFMTRTVDEDAPFCLMISWGPPHTPLEPPARHRETYAPESVSIPASVPDELEALARQERAAYLGLCTALDDNVGRLLDSLDMLGLADNTIVVFTSDHGDSIGEHGLFRKTIPFDESTHVPCIARWPGRIAADVTSDTLFHSVDFAPTVLGLVGIDAGSVQGYDVSDVLMGTGSVERPPVYMEGRVHRDNEWWGSGVPVFDLPDRWRALRTHQYLLSTDTEGKVFLLFNLATDPLAMNNLAGKPVWKEVEQQLLDRLRQTARELGDPAALAQRT